MTNVRCAKCGMVFDDEFMKIHYERCVNKKVNRDV